MNCHMRSVLNISSDVLESQVFVPAAPSGDGQFREGSSANVVRVLLIQLKGEFTGTGTPLFLPGTVSPRPVKAGPCASHVILGETDTENSTSYLPCRG